jgi:N6-adenosine-specific RNA methylase IME4
LPEARTEQIGLGGVNVRPERLRALRSNVVDDLVASMRECGQLQAIVVRPCPDIGYWLIAGRHRLEAAKQLKWPSIRCTILEEMDADQAELAEIDENLIRADLTPAERAMHHTRRKELYEKAHPETKQGKAPGAGRGKGKRRLEGSQNENFVNDTAAKTGKGRSTVARDVTRGEKVVVLPDIAGTCLDKGDEIDALAKLPANDQRTLAKAAKTGHKVSAKTRLKQVKRNNRERELGEQQIVYPTEQYGVILCDDEWDHQVYSRETGMDRHAANHYETAKDAHTAEELHERTKARFTPAPDCVLFMWATVQHLDIAIDLLRLRGFTYKSHYAWGKDKAGLGYWNRNKHEILLIGVRGDIPCPAPGTQWDSLIMAPVGEHSEKPECFLEMIEQYFPTLPKIEINRRGPPRPGWDAWGNEVEPGTEWNEMWSRPFAGTDAERLP